ncbi:hypothetical protein DFH09DRAFT_1097696 [Mycena vulgaris]|nr:hypothetical protein DFH09DRAFT_1097696 [Mycena vulgaris]
MCLRPGMTCTGLTGRWRRSLNLAGRAWRAWLAAWRDLCSLNTHPFHLPPDSSDGLGKTACPAQRNLKLAVRAWMTWLVAGLDLSSLTPSFTTHLRIASLLSMAAFAHPENTRLSASNVTPHGDPFVLRIPEFSVLILITCLIKTVS